MTNATHSSSKKIREEIGDFETESNGESENENVFDRGLTGMPATTYFGYHGFMIVGDGITVKLLEPDRILRFSCR